MQEQNMPLVRRALQPNGHQVQSQALAKPLMLPLRWRLL